MQISSAFSPLSLFRKFLYKVAFHKNLHFLCSLHVATLMFYRCIVGALMIKEASTCQFKHFLMIFAHKIASCSEIVSHIGSFFFFLPCL